VNAKRRELLAVRGQILKHRTYGPGGDAGISNPISMLNEYAQQHQLPVPGYPCTAELLEISRQRVLQMIDEGKLPGA